MIALIGKMVNYVMNWKPGAKRGRNQPKTTAKRREQARTGVLRPQAARSQKIRQIRFDLNREPDSDGVRRLYEVRQ